VGWVTSGDSKSNQSHPSLDAYADKESFWHLLSVLEKVATDTSSTPARVAIAWLLARPAVSSVVIGARTLEQLQDNMAAAHLSLTQEQVHTLFRFGCSYDRDRVNYRFCNWMRPAKYLYLTLTNLSSDFSREDEENNRPSVKKILSW